MRIKRGNVSRNRHKKILKLAKGFIGARSRIFKVANTMCDRNKSYIFNKTQHAQTLDCKN